MHVLLNYFPLSIFEFVANKRNRHAESIQSRVEKLSPGSRFNKGQGITDQNMKACVAVEIAMGLVHKPTLESHFQDTYWLTQTPGFSTVFTKDEYQLLGPSFIFPMMIMNHQRLMGLQKSGP